MAGGDTEPIERVAAVLTSMVPPGVAAEASSPASAEGELFPEEAEAVRKAVPKRRIEFAEGRVAARRALSRVGAPVGAIPVGDRRQPVWPAGFVGSITHCEGLAAAVAAPRTVALGLGIDAEPASPISSKLLRLILTPGERGLLGEDLLLAKAVFSAKESIYKALFPAFGVPLGFHDVEVELAPAEGDPDPVPFRVRSAPRAALTSPGLERLHGRWGVVNGFVLTAAFLVPE